MTESLNLADRNQPTRISNSNSVYALLANQSRVIGSLTLRNMRTRFGGSILSYSVSILWPLTHIGIIITLYTSLGRQPSFGTNMIVWVTSGVIPYVLYYYPLRWILFCLSTNGALLSFPVVKRQDIILSVVFLEILTCGMVVISVFTILAIFGTLIIPHSIATTLQAMLASCFLGIGLGTFGAPIVVRLPFFGIVIILVSIVMWMTGGVLYLPDSVPEPYRSNLAFNPFVHATEWMRTGIFENYRSETLNKSYLLSVSSVLFFSGLLLERVLKK